MRFVVHDDTQANAIDAGFVLESCIRFSHQGKRQACATTRDAITPEEAYPCIKNGLAKSKGKDVAPQAKKNADNVNNSSSSSSNCRQIIKPTTITTLTMMMTAILMKMMTSTIPVEMITIQFFVHLIIFHTRISPSLSLRYLKSLMLSKLTKTPTNQRRARHVHGVGRGFLDYSVLDQSWNIAWRNFGNRSEPILVIPSLIPRSMVG